MAAGQVQLKAALDDGRVRVEVLAYAGGPIWISKKLYIFDLAGLELPGRVLLLADHKEEIGAIIGSGQPVVRGGQLWVAGELVPANEAAKAIIDLLKAGTPVQASVGVEISKTETVQGTVELNGRKIDLPEPATVVRAGTLKEVSLVPLGADAETAVFLVAKHDGTVLIKGVLKDMDATDTKTPTLETKLTADDREARLQALRASRPTLSGVVRDVSLGGGPTDVLVAATLKLAGRRDLVQAQYNSAMVKTVGGVDSWKDLIHLAFSVTGRSHEEFGGNLLRAAWSTTDLPIALGTAIEKLAIDAYRTTPQTWRSFCRVLPAKTFREHVAIRLNEGANFGPVVGGELEHGLLTEETIRYKVDSYGKILKLDRSAIVNDDLQILTQLPQLIARSADRKESDVVYDVLTDADGFFSSAHKNLLTGASSALSFSSLADAVKLLRLQKDADGLPLDIVPKVLLVPPSLEATARALLASQELNQTGDLAPTGNPLSSLNLVLEVEPRLEDDSSTAWYLFGGPMDQPMIASFLNGQEAPTIETADPGPEFLGLAWRGYIDFGAALGDYRAAVKATGV
jgi:hypothetical protein